MLTRGKIHEVGGMQAVLQMVLSQAGSQHIIVRIISKQGAGRLAIQNCTFITGAQLSSGDTKGLAALDQLLAVNNGIYEFDESQRADEFDELDEKLQIPIAQLVADRKESGARTTSDTIVAEGASDRRKPQFQPSFKPKATLPLPTDSSAPGNDARSGAPTSVQPSVGDSVHSASSATAGSAGFFLQPDLPEDVNNRRQAIQAEQAARARRQESDPAQLLRRTAQKIKSRIHLDKAKSTARTTEVTRLKTLSGDQASDAEERRLRIDKPTVMGGVVTFAVIAGILTCKMLADMASPGEQLRKGQSALAAGQWDTAISALSLAISKQPSNVEALCLRATAYADNGQKQSALEDLNKVVEIAGTNAAPECLFRRAQVLFDLGSLPDSLQACQALLKVRPDDTRARTLLGMVDARSGSARKALEELSQPPADMVAQAAIHRGFALWKLNRLADSIEQYKIAASSLPENASVFYELGMVESQAGKLPQAKTDFEKAEQLDPHDGRIRIGLSDLRQHLGGQPSSALNGPSALKFGLASYDSGNFQQAAVYLKAAAEKGVCDNKDRSLLAHALKQSGETAAAYQQFLALAATDALQPGDQVSFAQCASSQSMLDDCIDVLTHALETNPQSIQTRLALILSYKKAGQKESASRLVDEGMQITQSAKDQDLLKTALN
jgi:tetratricopeptide (TPR) repeat protein